MPLRPVRSNRFGQPSAESWAVLRSCRSKPPGKAGGSVERREVFCAALDQAEQLFTAAEQTGYASRPLLLFYGLSQAGRALAAAANTDTWELKGHGITADDLHAPLTDVVLRDSGKPDGPGSFLRLAALLGSGTFAQPVPLVAIWDTLPELAGRPLFDAVDRRRRPVLTVIPLDLQVPSDRLAYLEGDWRYHLRVAGLPPYLIFAGSHSTPMLVELLADYPALAGGQPPPGGDDKELYAAPPLMGADIKDVVGGPAAFAQITRDTLLNTDPECPCFGSVDLSWPADAATSGIPSLTRPGPSRDLKYQQDLRRYVEQQQLERLLNTMSYRDPKVRWAFPAFGGNDRPLHPLLAWWAVLFALSMLARYQPREWIAHLDVDHSAHAVDLEIVLTEALDACPELILHALSDLTRMSPPRR
jgi:hypothetical protein